MSPERKFIKETGYKPEDIFSIHVDEYIRWLGIKNAEDDTDQLYFRGWEKVESEEVLNNLV